MHLSAQISSNHLEDVNLVQRTWWEWAGWLSVVAHDNGHTLPLLFWVGDDLDWAFSNHGLVEHGCAAEILSESWNHLSALNESGAAVWVLTNAVNLTAHLGAVEEDDWVLTPLIAE